MLTLMFADGEECTVWPHMQEWRIATTGANALHDVGHRPLTEVTQFGRRSLVGAVMATVIYLSLPGAAPRAFAGHACQPSCSIATKPAAPMLAVPEA